MRSIANELRSRSLLVLAFLAGGAGCSKDSSQGESPASSASASSVSTSAASSNPTPTQESADPGRADDGYDDQDPSAVSDFHPVLDSQGTWADDPKYGTVWIPSTAAVGSDFVPYQTGGHWTYGDDYTWVSDYDWGWAPFHYGRWVWIDGRGWSWIPGRRYAPAWVSWRVGAPGFGYIGWGPLAPSWGWRGGVAVTFGFPVVSRWSYCTTGDLFVAHGLSGHVLVGARVAEAEGGTRPWEGEGGRRGGPPPARVGIPADHVVHAPPNDPGLQHAKDFGKPSTAGPLGGHPPAKGGTNDKDPSSHPPSVVQDNPGKAKGSKPEPAPRPPPGNKPGNRHH